VLVNPPELPEGALALYATTVDAGDCQNGEELADLALPLEVVLFTSACESRMVSVAVVCSFLPRG